MRLVLQSIGLGIAIGLMYMMIVVAVSLIYAGQRVFHVAIGLTITVNAYAYYQLNNVGLPLWLDVLLNIGIAAALNIGCWLVYRIMLHYGASEDAVVMGSFSLLLIGEGVLSLVYGTSSRAVTQHWLQRPFHVSDVTVTHGDAIFGGVAVIVVSGLFLLLSKTWHGARIRAVFGSVRDALAAGINVKGVEVTCYLLASVCCSIAAIGLLLRQPVDPTFGEYPVFVGIVGTVAAGLGRVSRGVPVAIALGIVWELVGSYMGGVWQEGVVFGLFGLWLVVRAARRRGVVVA